MADRTRPRVVLIVEDERNLADLYATWLRDEYEIRTAYDAESALELLDDAVDVVLLDRRLPGMSGDEFLDHVHEAAYDCQVAMVSAVDPDFDIIEMGFDDYVVKPVEREELYAVIERLLSLGDAGVDTQEYFASVAKTEALEAEKDPHELEASEEYAALLQSIDSFRKHVLSLAEAYLDSPESTASLADERVYRQGLEEWQQRQQTLAETDPLYRTAQAEIEKYERLLSDAENQSQQEAERELLEVVASGFVAEGFWVDRRVRRALNEIFFDKPTDDMVIEQRRLGDGELSPDQLYDVSQAVRSRAASKLDAMA